MSCPACYSAYNETDRLRCVSCDSCLACHCTSNSRCVFSREMAFDPDRRIYTNRFNCRRLVGVEWEYSAYKNGRSDIAKIIAWCAKKGAGHKRDGSCLAEIVTSPIGGNRVIGQLTSLGQLINDATVVDHRCGVHVHVDARDIDPAGMDRLLLLYGKVEPVLYILAGIARAGSQYCRPHMDKPSFDDRYRGMNLTNWRAKRDRKTTVEFRMQQGTMDTDHVVNWAKLCALLVDFAVKSTMEKISAIKESPVQILRTIYPDGEAWILKCLKKYHKETKSAARTISFNKENTTWKVLAKKVGGIAPSPPPIRSTCGCPDCMEENARIAARAQAVPAVPVVVPARYRYNSTRWDRDSVF